MAQLTTSKSLLIATEVLAEGERRGFAPLCCVVLDSGGHALALLRDERASAAIKAAGLEAEAG